MRNVFETLTMENPADDTAENQVPIDPHEVIEGLSPLLNAQGHIRSTEEVEVMSNLMKDVKKLVGKCIYINIIKVTEDEKTLEKFIESDGWHTLHHWLQEANTTDNCPLQLELLEAYRGMPVNIEHLKLNNCAKLIKQLSKAPHADDVRSLAADIVNRWMAKIRETNDAAADKAKKKSKKIKERSSKEEASKSKAASSHSNAASADNKESSRSNKHEERTVTTDTQVDNNNMGLNDDDDSSSFTKPHPKSFKTVSTKFRSTGLLDQDPVPPTKKKRLDKDYTANNAGRKNSTSKVSSPTEKVIPPLIVKIPPPPGNNVSNPSPTEEHLRVKILTPTKIKVMPLHEIHESSGFMDAITSAPASNTQQRKKRKQSSASSKTSTSPTSLTPPKQPAVPSFYKDTLDTSSELLKENDTTQDGDKDETASNDTKDNDDSNSIAGESESSSTTDAGSRDATRKKKRVSWAEESAIRQFYYFEMDETERVNVNRIRDFAETKKHEMMMERQMLENVKKHGIDKMGWKRPALITGLPDTVTKAGINSKERDIQRQRELSVLQTIFFTKDMIPDMPAEPDYEPMEEPFNPKIIPLTEEGGSGVVQDYSAPPPLLQRADQIPYNDPPSAAVTFNDPQQLPPQQPPPAYAMSSELAGLVASMTSGVASMTAGEADAKDAPGTVAANVQRLLSSFMVVTDPQSVTSEDITAKLKQMLEPVQGQMTDPNQPPMDPMTQPPPGFPQAAGLLGSAPPGFPPHMRPPMPGGPRGPMPPFRHRGPMPPMMFHGGDEWGENIRGGPPCRPPGMPLRGGGGPRGHRRGLPMRGGMMMRGGPHRARVPSGQGERPICRNFSSPMGCRFGNKCAFIHPGMNAPPL